MMNQKYNAAHASQHSILVWLLGQYGCWSPSTKELHGCTYFWLVSDRWSIPTYITLHYEFSIVYIPIVYLPFSVQISKLVFNLDKFFGHFFHLNTTTTTFSIFELSLLMTNASESWVISDQQSANGCKGPQNIAIKYKQINCFFAFEIKH